MKSACSHRPRPTGGFTLLEMLAVLTIFALILAIVTPLIQPPRRSLILETTSHQLCAALRAARARSIAANKETEILIDLEKRFYKTEGNAATALPSTVGIELTMADERRTGATQGAYRFYPSGSSSGGEIVLNDEGKSVRITVGWLTGEATCAF